MILNYNKYLRTFCSSVFAISDISHSFVLQKKYSKNSERHGKSRYKIQKTHSFWRIFSYYGVI